MGLKRRVARAYSIDEMLFLINYDFIESGRSGKMKQGHTPHYVIGPTCFAGLEKRWLLADSRDEIDGDVVEDELDSYYGATIEEVVTACFMDRKNHGIYRIDAKLDG
tara:strand:- start:2839 stop:3159 length:321 start_codon:yes stop_codon:yes gene_type:complete